MKKLEEIAAMNIRHLRKAHRGSRLDLAQRIGFKHPNSIGNIERGSAKITLDILEKIAGAFQIEAYVLLSEKIDCEQATSGIVKQNLQLIQNAVDQIADALRIDA